jgi:hypothetical protein
MAEEKQWLKIKASGDMVQATGCLLFKHKVLSSNSRLTKKKIKVINFLNFFVKPFIRYLIFSIKTNLDYFIFFLLAVFKYIYFYYIEKNLLKTCFHF